LLYPGNVKKKYTKEITYGNRGMALEYLIEQANTYYIENDYAYIYKKPTPIKATRVSYKNGGKRITDAYYEAPSTLDFNGLYKGYYIEFDAKETTNKTSFPISNVHPHQIRHIRNINNHGGIVFLIIAMNEKYYLLMGSTFLQFIDNETRKSIPYEFIKDNAYEIKLSLKGIDYLPIIDKIIGGKNEKN
jgi:recombination protein U